MIFPKYFLFFAAVLLALLQSTLARPYPLFDDGLIERETSEDTLFKRGVTDFDARNNILGWFPELERRAPPRRAKQQQKQPQRQQQKQQTQKGQGAYTWAKSANKELNRMGLHGQAREDAKKWHEKQVAEHIKANLALQGAQKTVIHHVAHSGGSDPNAPFHVTASFRDNNNKEIKKMHNGKETPHHHLDVSYDGLPSKAAFLQNNAAIQAKNSKKGGGKTKP
jgi:hypothetical protein